MDRLTIGQMAKLHGVSEKTLRLYHNSGLLVPDEVDPQTGYRYYSLLQSSQLDIIQQLKAIGLSLSEIKTILNKKSVDYLHHMLDQQLSAIDSELSRLRLARLTAIGLKNTCGLLEHKPECDRPTLEILPDRRIIKLDIEPYKLDEAHSESGPALTAWELSLRKAKMQFINMGLPLTLFHNVGCLIKKGNLETGNLLVERAFIFFDEELEGTVTELVPGGAYLSVICDGMTSASGSYKERQYLNLLLETAKEKGFELNGDYLGEVLAETPAFLYEGRDMMVKLQIPVRLPKLI